MNTPVISVCIIDDHPLLSQGLAFILNKEPDIQVIGLHHSGLEGCQFLQNNKADIVLLDLEMPGMNGTETLRHLLTYDPTTRVLILTMSEEAEHLHECLNLGAYGYILKNTETEFLLHAIRQAHSGNKTLSQEMMNKLYSTPTQNTPSLFQSGLTERELDVLWFIAQGTSNKVIAFELGLSENTIKVHVQNLLRKLQLSSRTQASIYANEQKILERHIRKDKTSTLQSTQ